MIDIVVGGQYGSEGKGKVAYYLATRSEHKCVARVGGANSGHTIRNSILRHLPASALIDDGICIIGAGSYLDVKVLLTEISRYKPNKLYIDSKAVVINSVEDRDLRHRISSTMSGTGKAVSQRINRIVEDVTFVGDIKALRKYIVSTSDIQDIIHKGCIIEGTQGFGLSNIHTPHYPYCTSRDTTAAGFMSELGVSPKMVRDVYLVIRTYPIRVGGNSGPLLDEFQWSDIHCKPEYTSVTKKIRRIGMPDFNLIKQAIKTNAPSYIILNHLDYIEEDARISYIKMFEKEIDHKISYIGLSPKVILPIV